MTSFPKKSDKVGFRSRYISLLLVIQKFYIRALQTAVRRERKPHETNILGFEPGRSTTSVGCHFFGVQNVFLGIQRSAKVVLIKGYKFFWMQKLFFGIQFFWIQKTFLGIDNFLRIHKLFGIHKLFLGYQNFFGIPETFFGIPNVFRDTKSFFGIQSFG